MSVIQGLAEYFCPVRDVSHPAPEQKTDMVTESGYPWFHILDSVQESFPKNNIIKYKMIHLLSQVRKVAYLQHMPSV